MKRKYFFGGASALLLFFAAYSILPVQAAAPKFSPGNRVEVSVKVTNVRAMPAGTILGEQRKAATGTLMGGPVFKSNHYWWLVDFDTGLDGWVIQANLKTSLSAPPSANPYAPYDYTNDQKIDASDIAFLTDVSNRTKSCPVEKKCDINADGVVDFIDVFLLRDIRHDMNGDGVLTDADPQIVAEVVVALRTCPVGKSCDINETGFVTPDDASALAKFVLARTSITVSSPNGGEVLTAGSLVNIKWSTVSTASDTQIRIVRRFVGDASTPGGNDVFVDTVPNTGSYTWPVSAGLPVGRYIIGLTRMVTPSVPALADDYSGASFSVVGGGGWSVAVAGSAPTEKWIVAGTTGVTLNVLRFSATTEDFALANLRLQVSTKGSSTAGDYAKISLWDGATKIIEKVPAFVNGVEDFTFPMSGVGSFVIPRDSYKDVAIKVDVAGIGPILSGTAGELIGIDYDGSSPDKNKAVGLFSGLSTKSSTWQDQQGSGAVMFQSIPRLEALALPTTTLTSGDHVLYKFQVTADPAYDVALHQFTFQVATTGVTGLSAQGGSRGNFVLRDVTDGNKRIAIATGTSAEFYSDMARYSDTSGTLLFKIIADTTDYSNPWVVVPAGQTHIFELRGNVATDGSGDSITTRLVTDQARPAGVSLVGPGYRRMIKPSLINHWPGVMEIDQAAVASSTAFIWSDFSSDASTTHSINTADWMNGYKLPRLSGSSLQSAGLFNAAPAPKKLAGSNTSYTASVLQSIQTQLEEMLRKIQSLGF